MRRNTALTITLALSLCGACALAQQDPEPVTRGVKPAKRSVKATNFEEVLRPFIGRQCRRIAGNGFVTLDFRSSNPNRTLDMIGKDFVRLSDKSGKSYYPFTSITSIIAR